MSEVEAENDLSIWLSTYGLITAERILAKYHIHLQQEELITTIKNPHTFFHRLLKVPLKNVFNGIILQQANDYQIYAQKLFIDYLISGESGKSEESPGGLTREDLENERKKLVSMAEDFQQDELAHNELIAETQKSLIHYVGEWQKILSTAAKKISADLQVHGVNKEEKLIAEAIRALLIRLGESISMKGDASWSPAEKVLGQQLSTETKRIFAEQISELRNYSAALEGSLNDFINTINGMGAKLRQWRTDFYDLILRTNELIKLLPDYRYDVAQNQENRESLYFDSDIGKQ